MAKPTTEAAAQALAAVGNCLRMHGVPFMLDGGTLLGAVRDGTFCADDQDDIDLTVIGTAEALPAAIKQAAMLGFHVHHAWPHSAQGTSQIALMRKGVKVDIMLKERVRLEDSEGEWMYWTVYGRNDRVVRKAIPLHLVEPWSMVYFHGRQYHVPGRVEAYLHYRYGDWRTPVHRSAYNCYTTDQAILPAAVKVIRLQWASPSARSTPCITDTSGCSSVPDSNVTGWWCA